MVASFGANHHTPRVWTAAEIELVRQVAERTWDAVERARAEAALRQQTSRLSLALEASSGGSWTWDFRTNDGDWDDAFRAQTRIHAGRTATIRHVAGTCARRRPCADVPHNRGGPADSGTRGITHTASCSLMAQVRWMQSLGRAERDETGQVTRLTGLELDITERRRAEDALQARRDEEYDRTLRTLLETATQGIVSAAPQGTLVFANRAVEAMFGWAADELIGQPIAHLIPSAVLRDGTTLSGPSGPRRPAQGRVDVSDRSHRQPRADAERRTRIRVHHRHHRTAACRGGAAGALGRTRIPDDATESDGVGPDARRAPCARADREDAARRAAAAPGHRRVEPRAAAETGERHRRRRARCSKRQSSSSTKRWRSRGR